MNLKSWKTSAASFVLVLAGVLLFLTAHPGYICKEGLSFLGFFALLPVFAAMIVFIFSRVFKMCFAAISISVA